MGHAINKNVSKIGKALQKLRPLQILAPLGVMLVAMTTKETANSAEGEGGARQFIKDNAGVLATMGWIPAIAEEALATKNGNSIAQKALSSAPDLLNKVKKHLPFRLFSTAPVLQKVLFGQWRFRPF